MTFVFHKCENSSGLTSKGLDQYGFYKSGVNKDGCSFYFQGPFAPLISFRLHSILSQQPQSFLSTIPRTCTGLERLPDFWMNVNWATESVDMSSE